MKIGLLGCGVVGSGVKEIIDLKYKNINIEKILVKDENEISENRMTADVDEFFKSDIDLVVECIGGIDIPLKYITRALNNKKHVVTSNKKVLATHYSELIELAKKNNVILAFEASVAGGIPWLENIRHIKRVDNIESFEGIFNGTTNYILDNMTNKNLDFDVVLQKAQNLGYAESDPTDDIDGYDVKYKCCLSGNLIWNTDFRLDDILHFGIRNISKVDIDYATKNNYVIKLIGKGKKIGSEASLLVIPTFTKKSENMAHISNNLNCVKLNSEFLGESSYIGQGAGKYPTAHAVVQDIVSIFEGRDLSTNIYEKIAVKKNYIGNFYIRSSDLTRFENLILEKIDSNTIITKKTDIEKIENLIDKNTFIVEIKL